MKKIMLVLAALLCATGAFAQDFRDFYKDDVTTFLGIPVDGFKRDMIKKLQAKGYELKYNNGTEYLEGEFNGKGVYIFIVTNNNKVYRVMVSEKNKVSEAQIKINFNTLVRQFENNGRYTYYEDQTIPEDEDISYNMTVKNKVYEAVFYQKSNDDKVDYEGLETYVDKLMREKYTQEQIDNPTAEMKQDAIELMVGLLKEMTLSKLVWFRIEREYGDYYINIYYDNERNKANGEDL